MEEQFSVSLPSIPAIHQPLAVFLKCFILLDPVGLIIAAFVTLVLGRVLWVYEVEPKYYEIDDEIKAKV